MGPYRAVALNAVLVAPGQSDLARHATVRATGDAMDIPVPPLAAGQHVFSRLPLMQHPPDADWRETSYRAATLWVVTFRDVTVFGEAGLVVAGHDIVADTLGRADPASDRFIADGDHVRLQLTGSTHRIDGPCLSLLGVGSASVYHWTVDGIGRMAAADRAALDGITDLLLPANLGPFQRELLGWAGLPGRLTVHPVAAGDAVRVRHLVLPWSVESDFTRGGNHRPHPALGSYYRGRRPMAGGPKRIYVDRSGGANRRLLNETEVISALAARGFVSIRMETLEPLAQVGLFAQADCIVAPHGSGLAHLVHARPGTRVLELHAAHWVNWCFRRHAAALGLRYDAVVGPPAGGDEGAHVNTRPWMVSVTHMLAALDELLRS